jgi:hypothetical protein
MGSSCSASLEGSKTIDASGENGRFRVRMTGPDHVSGEPSLQDPLMPPLTLEITGPAGANVHIISIGEPSNGCHFDQSFPDVTLGRDGAATTRAVGFFGRADGCAYEASVVLYEGGRDPHSTPQEGDDVARPRLDVPVE